MILNAAVDTVRSGRPVVVIDAGECAAVLAAHDARTEWVAWVVRHSSGLLCAPMPAARADELDLPPMIRRNQGADPPYTVSVDARHGVTTGISAADRARTFQALGSPDTVPTDLIRPGHVLPLCTRPGGLVERQALPETAVDLCALAGTSPVALSATLLDHDGELLGSAGARELATRHDLPECTVGDLYDHRIRQHEPPVTRSR